MTDTGEMYRTARAKVRIVGFGVRSARCTFMHCRDYRSGLCWPSERLGDVMWREGKGERSVLSKHCKPSASSLPFIHPPSNPSQLNSGKIM